MREKTPTILLIAIAFICIFVFLSLFRNSANTPSSGLSEILLRAEDFDYAKFPYQVGRKKLSFQCSDVLFLPGFSLPPSTNCSQVRFDGQDSKVVMLNGMWVFDTTELASNAFERISELFVGDSNLAFKDDIFVFGDKIISFNMTEELAGQPVYVQNIMWQDDNFLVRLVYLGETPIDYDILVHLAAPIELRIMVSLSQ